MSAIVREIVVTARLEGEVAAMSASVREEFNVTSTVSSDREARARTPWGEPIQPCLLGRGC
jgi:hypothetical protein